MTHHYCDDNFSNPNAMNSITISISKVHAHHARENEMNDACHSTHKRTLTTTNLMMNEPRARALAHWKNAKTMRASVLHPRCFQTNEKSAHESTCYYDVVGRLVFDKNEEVTVAEEDYSLERTSAKERASDAASSEAWKDARCALLDMQGTRAADFPFLELAHYSRV